MKLITTLLEFIERGLTFITDLAQALLLAVFEFTEQFPRISFIFLLPIMLAAIVAFFVLYFRLAGAIKRSFGSDVLLLFYLAVSVGGVWFISRPRRS
jgi:ABC-type multidrug transport system permease subunit